MTRPIAGMAAALALSLGLAMPAAAFDPASMSDAEKAAFGQAVRDYLMANPEVLIESINVLEERRAADESKNDTLLVETFKADIFDDGHSWSGGNPDGSVTVVEFIDYRCGVCRQVYGEVEDLVSADGDIRIIFKEFPILGEESDLAARFAIAVQQIAGDDAYKTAHDKLMTMRGRVTLESLSGVAEEMDLDSKAIIARMNTEDVTTVIRQNHQLAEKMRIAGTPTFVVGPELLRGAPREGLGAIVDDIRAKQKG